MKINLDDPVLTAYALNELDEATRAEVEQALADSPEGQQAVEEIRRMAGLLTVQLEQEPQLSTAGADRQNLVETVLEADGKIVSLPTDEPVAESGSLRSWRKVIIYGGLAAAACLALVLSLPDFYARGKAKAQRKVLDESTTKVRSEESSSSTAPPVTETSNPEPQTTTQPRVASNGTTPLTTFNESANSPAPIPVNRPAATQTPSATLQPLDVNSVRESEHLQTQPQKAAKPVDQLALVEHAPSPNLTLTPSRPNQSGRGGGAAPSPTPATAYRWRASTETLAQSEQKPPANPSARSLSPGNSANSSRSRMDPVLARRYGLTPPDAYSPEATFQKSVESKFSFERELSQNTATYPRYVENSFLPVLQNPLSTLSLDVDTACYANVRRFLNQGQLPPRDAVRIEELINYFPYQYSEPRRGEPFSANTEVADCPWNPEHRLIRVAIKAHDLTSAKRPAANFVFLIDVSGSMQPRERLPLIKQALRLLVKGLTPQDRVAIVVYASNSGIALPSTSAEEKDRILSAIDRLEAGGSTNGGEGIQQAYALASENFIQGGVNRVILCTDGDFNVGITSQDALVQLIRDKARSGVFLSALGVGTDNYKDALMQNLADKGNGNYHYIDTLEEAQKVLIEERNATLVTVAKDVKIQIEFNPAAVGSYRLIGYEKRLLRNEDFNNDRKDAAEVGAGQAVTVLYEVTPAGVETLVTENEPLKYQPVATRERRVPTARVNNAELLTLKLRYKKPESAESQLLEFVARDPSASYRQASKDFKFAASVASFGMLLRGSEYKGNATYESVLELAQDGKGTDEQGLRSEFLNLVRRAKELSGQTR